MQMPLEDWQRRLERHFQQLATARSNSGFPLFALEHDLTAEASLKEEIGTQLRSQLALGLRLDPRTGFCGSSTRPNSATTTPTVVNTGTRLKNAHRAGGTRAVVTSFGSGSPGSNWSTKALSRPVPGPATFLSSPGLSPMPSCPNIFNGNSQRLSMICATASQRSKP